MAIITSQHLHCNEVGTGGNAHRHLFEDSKVFGRSDNLGFDAGGRKKQVDIYGPFAISSETHRRDSTCLFLLEQHPYNILAVLEMKYELFRGSVAVSGDGDVDVSGRTRLCARRDCEAANESTRHTGVGELRENALQRALDGIQRRGHAAGIPTPSPNSAPGR
ncbi:MAG TPA: hypothetical protein VHW01_03250, partial [Polyangiaceae bacterium]|nr:hypothetical protein [Polyangiaceae bacterium]